tara:strand:- start:49935 stop:51521 length:1587 start_codon:yes stop_codon:yes gene_type:complete
VSASKSIRFGVSILAVVWCVGSLFVPTTSHAQWVSAKHIKPNTLGSKKLALLIGISKFTSPQWSNIDYASNDVHKMAHVLRKLGKFDRIMLRTSQKNTTKQSLLQAVKRLREHVKVSLDTVVVYISSHGTISSPPGNKHRLRYIITSDTDQRITQTALPVQKLLKLLKTFRSKKVVLILATCYTYAPNSKAILHPGLKGNTTPTRSLRTRAMQILSAAARSQPAFESRTLRSDVYTHFFTECAKKLAKKGKRQITAIDIHVCALAPTREFVKKHKGTNQVPVVYSERGANYDIPLIQSKTTKRQLGYLRTASLSPATRYTIVRLGAKSAKPIDASAGELLALPPGRYRISQVDAQGKTIYDKTLNIQQDQIAEWSSEWTLDAQAGGWFSQKGGTQQLWGGYIGVHHSFFGLKLGVWSTQKTYLASPPSQQLYLELRGEAGFRNQWHSFSLFTGAYASLGVMWKHFLHPAQPTGAASVFNYGVTVTPGLWLSPTWGIHLQLDAGFTVLQLAELTNQFEWSARIGLYHRF